MASLVAMSDEPMAPEPDDKDWTFVLGQPCPDCGFDAAAVDRTEIPALVRSSAIPANASAMAALDSVSSPDTRAGSCAQ